MSLIKTVMKVENVESFVQKLRKTKRIADNGKTSNVVVGYTQYYAIYVHENLYAHHPIGQAKFLEIPIRRHRKTIVSMVKDAVKAGATLRQALSRAGTFLKRESVAMCPIDTGALRASAYVSVS